MLKIMADNGVEISAKQDGALYNVALNDQDFIIQGLGDEFAMSYTGLNVTVESGECIIHGRHITADTSNQISLPQNESGYLVLRVDLTKPVGQEALLFATPTLTHEEINWDGTIYDMPIATFTTTTIDISNFEDTRKIKSKAGGGMFYEEGIPTSITPLQMIDFLFPVGSVLLRNDSVNPSVFYTGTTWELIGTKLAVRENVFGNGISLGLTDGGSFASMSNVIDSNTYLYGAGNIGKNVGASVTNNVLGNRIIGVPTKSQLGANPQYSGLIVDTETIYSWRRIA